MYSWYVGHRLEAWVVLRLAPVINDDNRQAGLLRNGFDEINKLVCRPERGNQNR